MANVEDGKIKIPEGYSFSGKDSKITVKDVLTKLYEDFKDTQLGSNADAWVQQYSENLTRGEIITTAGTIVVAVVAIFVVYNIFGVEQAPIVTPKPKDDSKDAEDQPEMKDFTISQLREYDGSNGKPIYISLLHEVFDVSAAANFYGKESGYHCFAGREASRAMAKLSFEETDLSNVRIDDLGPFEKSTLDDWYTKFKHFKSYPVVGKVSFPPTDLMLNRAELAKFKGAGEVPEGRLSSPIYIGLNGKIFDVSYGGGEMYGAGGPYHLFAGIDASRALAKMSFKEEDTGSFDLSDLTPEQLRTLGEWERKFEDTRKYPIVGKLVE